MSSRTAGCSTHSGGSRTRRTVTAVLVVLGILVALGLAFWGAAAVRGILTLTSRLSQLQVRCPRLPRLPRLARRERQARLWPVSAPQPQAIGPVPAKIVVPSARSYLIPGMQIRAMTCRNVVRGKTTFWLHNLGRSGERAVRRRSLVIKELSRSTSERQNARIWAAPITAPRVRAGRQIGGYSRGCHRLVGHAL